MIDEFKSAGYKITLFYFGLESLDESTYRVIIEYNFHEGIKRIQQNLHIFDNITFVDGNSNYGEVIAIYIKKSAKHEVSNHGIKWFNHFFAEAFKELK